MSNMKCWYHIYGRSGVENNKLRIDLTDNLSLLIIPLEGDATIWSVYKVWEGFSPSLIKRFNDMLKAKKWAEDEFRGYLADEKIKGPSILKWYYPKGDIYQAHVGDSMQVRVISSLFVINKKAEKGWTVEILVEGKEAYSTATQFSSASDAKKWVESDACHFECANRLYLSQSHIPKCSPLRKHK